MEPQRPRSDPSVWSEPQFRGTPIDAGSADALGDEPVRSSEPRDPVADGPDGELEAELESSARDEPSLAWNQRDLANTEGYGELLDRRRATTGAAARWMTVAGLALAAGPFGVVGALYAALGGDSGVGGLAVVVTAPVVEEMAKVALLLWVVERKPWLMPGAGATVLAGVLSGAVFGAIENVIYLNVYFPDRAAEIAPWRWLATAPMHAVASGLAAVGVARMWSGAMRERKPARFSLAYPWILAAMVLHGAFNAMALLLEWTGVVP